MVVVVMKLLVVVVVLLVAEGASARPPAGEGESAEGREGIRNKRNSVICSSRDILEMANRVCDLARRSAGYLPVGQ